MSSAGEPVPEGQPDYSTWSNSSLISRITELERQLHSRTTQYSASPSNPALNDAAADAAASNPAPPSIPSGDDNTKAVEDSAKGASEKNAKKRPLSPGDTDITHTPAPSRPLKSGREIDPSKYNTRFIALKFAYLGQRYNGYEHANGNITPLPTIEEELWKALRRTRLILPTNPTSDEFKEQGPRVLKPYSIDWEGCDYSKAGRTDRGVSAFGQVIGIRLRSARPKNTKAATEDGDSKDTIAEDNWDDIADELPYVSMLNRVLPEDIRMLAWCPHPPAGFDARFSCRQRRYKYFFTQPAFSPTPGPLGFSQNGTSPTKYREGWLDIDAMREAAKYFEGVHDFRNFCKVDTSKQIENFERIIARADIEVVDPKINSIGYVGQPGFQALEDTPMENGLDAPSTGQVYVFTLHGSAFLWHQVRHIVGVLFLVGQGLESPTIVRDLLDISKNPRKPTYEMASDAPLVLWDCIFPDETTDSQEDSLEWIHAGDPRMFKSQSGKGDGKFGIGGVVDGLWSVWRQRKMDEILASSLIDLAVSQGDQSIISQGGFRQGSSAKQNRGQKLFTGGDEPRVGGKYIPVMQKRKVESVEVLNAKWLATKQRKIAKKQDGNDGNA
ncbi:hypothetical protein MW887_005387 [Aspergillus wentii]|nr:hypothetical protein MW887_005387 [Aspergillus wentii]